MAKEQEQSMGVEGQRNKLDRRRKPALKTRATMIAADMALAACIYTNKIIEAQLTLVGDLVSIFTPRR